MISLELYKTVGVVVWKVNGLEIRFETDADTALLLTECLYKSNVKVKPLGVLEVEVKEGRKTKKRSKDWSRYISRGTLSKVEKVMKELGKFRYNDVIMRSGFSKSTIMRAIRVLTDKGKIHYDENEKVFVYLK